MYSCSLSAHRPTDHDCCAKVFAPESEELCTPGVYALKSAVSRLAQVKAVFHYASNTIFEPTLKLTDGAVNTIQNRRCTNLKIVGWPNPWVGGK